MLSDDKEFLSICIPTRNRARYLNDLLGMISEQFRESETVANSVRVYVSDNASDDDTESVVASYKERLPGLGYHRNPSNIGGDGNILQVREFGRGDYIWVMGDDEVLKEGALSRVLGSLKESKCGLLIAFNVEYEIGLMLPAVFPNYSEFVRTCVHQNVHALAQHTLISSNIYRADCFDKEYALGRMATNYPHMYGMIHPLKKNGGTVVVPDYPVISIREMYPYPMEIEGSWVDIDQQWGSYFSWLRDEVAVPELDPLAPSRAAMAIMRRKILRHPLRYFWDNRRVWFKPSAYRFLIRRLTGKGSCEARN